MCPQQVGGIAMRSDVWPTGARKIGSRTGKSTTICLPNGALFTPRYQGFCTARGWALAEQATVGGRGLSCPGQLPSPLLAVKLIASVIKWQEGPARDNCDAVDRSA